MRNDRLKAARSTCEWQFIHFALIYSLSNANGNISSDVRVRARNANESILLVGASGAFDSDPRRNFFYSFVRSSLFMMFSFKESSSEAPPFFTRLLTAARLLIALNTLTISFELSSHISHFDRVVLPCLARYGKATWFGLFFYTK